MRLHHEYLGLIPFEQALQRERLHLDSRVNTDLILGFESHPVITLGRRGEFADVGGSELPVLHVERGGQATVHEPGQLVIFPLVDLRVRQLGVRSWVELLAQVTAESIQELWGVKLRWDTARPGLYSDHGKVVSVGVRVRHGVSTHGLAINVYNDLAGFSGVAACGVRSPALDSLARAGRRLGVRQGPSLADLFGAWFFQFSRRLTSVEKPSNLATSLVMRL